MAESLAFDAALDGPINLPKLTGDLAMPLDELVWRQRLAERRADKLHALSDECGARRCYITLINLAIRAHTRADQLSTLIVRMEARRG